MVHSIYQTESQVQKLKVTKNIKILKITLEILFMIMGSYIHDHGSY
jgi:hypothetical protein